MGDSEGEVWIGPSGVVLTGVHAAYQCTGRGCVLHPPSAQHMRDWPVVWRDGRGPVLDGMNVIGWLAAGHAPDRLLELVARLEERQEAVVTRAGLRIWSAHRRVRPRRARRDHDRLTLIGLGTN